MFLPGTGAAELAEGNRSMRTTRVFQLSAFGRLMLSFLFGIGPASSIQCAQPQSPQGTFTPGAGTASSPLPSSPGEQEAGTKPSPPLGSRLGESALPSLVASNTAFALDLYGRLRHGPGNLFFSPYSISACLAMVYAGARGETERQMAQVLRFSQDQPRVHSSFGELKRQLREIGKQKAVELSIANGLWAQAGHSFLPAFLNVAKIDYQANLSQVDFKTGAEAVRGVINHWVAQQTKDKIQDLLPPGSVTARTRLVLANAIYFKGAWATPFDKSQTSPQPFHLSVASQVQAPLMRHFDTVNYLENSDFQAVELPYRGYYLSMIVLLPHRIDGCGPLESRLTPALLSGLAAQLQPQRVESLPSQVQTRVRLRPQRHARKNGPARRLRAEGGFLRHGWHAVPVRSPAFSTRPGPRSTKKAPRRPRQQARSRDPPPSGGQCRRQSSVPTIPSFFSSATPIPGVSSSWAGWRTRAREKGVSNPAGLS